MAQDQFLYWLEYRVLLNDWLPKQPTLPYYLSIAEQEKMDSCLFQSMKWNANNLIQISTWVTDSISYDDNRICSHIKSFGLVGFWPGRLGSNPGWLILNTQKWYLMLSCLTLSIIKYVSIVKRSNPRKGEAPSPVPRCSSYWKGSLCITLDYGRQLYFCGISTIIGYLIPSPIWFVNIFYR